MKRFVLFFTAILPFFLSSAALSEPFAPARLKLTCDWAINYDFSGSTIDIPVIVSGAPAGVIFCIFTKNHTWNTNHITNGYLGWHYVNKIDTCIYVSRLYSFEPGKNVITWDGRDQDGNPVPRDVYTYYLWGYDNKS